MLDQHVRPHMTPAVLSLDTLCSIKTSIRRRSLFINDCCYITNASYSSHPTVAKWLHWILRVHTSMQTWRRSTRETKLRLSCISIYRIWRTVNILIRSIVIYTVVVKVGRNMIIKAYVDAAYRVHQNSGESYTGWAILLRESGSVLSSNLVQRPSQ